MLVHEMQSESWLFSVDFSAAFGLINHDGFIFMLQSVRVGDKVLIFSTDFFFLVDNIVFMLIVVLAHIPVCPLGLLSILSLTPCS